MAAEVVVDEPRAVLVVGQGFSALEQLELRRPHERLPGEQGFKDRDLYPFCGGADGNFTAHPSLVGKSLKDLKDKGGKPLGEQIYAAAKEGTVSEVAYLWPRPGTTEPVQKVSFVTKVGDQVCAVGYYK